jgi:hypothetical protein
VTQVSEVKPDLVVATGHDLHFEQRRGTQPAKESVARFSRLPIGCDDGMSTEILNGKSQHTLGLAKVTEDNREIGLVNASLLELIHQQSACFLILRTKDDTAGFAINTMDRPRFDSLLFKAINKRRLFRPVATSRRRRGHRQEARRLGDDQTAIILEEQIEWPSPFG